MVQMQLIRSISLVIEQVYLTQTSVHLLASVQIIFSSCQTQDNHIKIPIKAVSSLFFNSSTENKELDQTRIDFVLGYTYYQPDAKTTNQTLSPRYHHV